MKRLEACLLLQSLLKGVVVDRGGWSFAHLDQPLRRLPTHRPGSDGAEKPLTVSLACGKTHS